MGLWTHARRFCFAPILLAALACTGGTGPGEHVGEIRSHIFSEEIEGYQVYEPADKQDDPRAQGPEYVYLVIGEEAVRLEGPSITVPDAAELDALFEFRSPSVETLVETLPEGTRDVGIDVRVNERLSYRFSIDDFENEGTLLGSATLRLLEDTIHSEFVFGATGSPGIAHDVTIETRVDGEPVGSPTEPISIEVRHSEDACIVHEAEWVEEFLLPRRECEPEDTCLVLSAPGNCWHGTVNEALHTKSKTIELEINCPENCEIPAPVAAECHEGLCQLVF